MRKVVCKLSLLILPYFILLSTPILSAPDPSKISKASPINSWYERYEMGYIFETVSANQPAPELGSIQKESLSEHVIMGRLNIGHFFKSGSFNGSVGYHLDLGLRTPNEQASDFVNKPSGNDLPYRFRTSERNHRLIFNSRYNFNPSIYTDFTSYWEISKTGSNISPGTAESRRESLTANERYFLKPNFGVSYGEDYDLSTELAIIFFKDKSFEANEFSFQSYSSIKDEPSYELNQNWRIPFLKTIITGRLYTYNQRFNFPEKDFSRRGALLKSIYQGNKLSFGALFANFKDSYQKSVVQANGCPSIAQSCQRIDEGNQYIIGASYRFYNQFSVEGYMENTSIKNQDYAVFNDTEAKYLISLSWQDQMPIGLNRFEDRNSPFGFTNRTDQSF